jgi:hypothetical protein
MYVRSGKTDPGVAVSFGFGVGCWPKSEAWRDEPADHERGDADSHVSHGCSLGRESERSGHVR